MSDWPEYPGNPWAKPGSPQTAFDAARSMREQAQTIRAKALGVVADSAAHGATGDDVANSLGLHVSQVRSRLSELVAAKMIAESGNVRLGESGRMTTVWVLKEYAPDDDAEPEADAA